MLISWLALGQLLGSVVSQSLSINGLGDIMNVLGQGQQQMNLENLDERDKLRTEYDFIVVGAGTAGCALAARLSENPKWRVLLVEAGGPESLIMDIPILVHFLSLGESNWQYHTQPSSKFCLGMTNNRCHWPRGKVMGGSSVLNYMMYTRANRLDYDRWAALGNPGWSFEEVLPYFRKFEGSNIPDADTGWAQPGHQGPVKISYSLYRSSVVDAFLQASQQDGLRRGDYNGADQLAVSYLQSTTQNATRWSSNRAYLYPIKGKRPNLHVKKNALVTRVLIDPQTKTAYGIMLQTGGSTRKILARREVILSAGAINTPQLLMLSGVGPAKHLREVGIKPIVNLAVGYNLQDHIAPGVTFECNASSFHMSNFLSLEAISAFSKGQGPYSVPGAVEAISFYALDKDAAEYGWPDMEFFQVGSSFHLNAALRLSFSIRPDIYKYMFQDLERTDKNSFSIFPMLLRPKSRGRIRLRSRNPLQHPLIYPNYFADPYDLNITVRGLQRAVSLIDKPAFRAINARVLNKPMPGCQHLEWLSWDYWACYARHFTFTIYHYSGTAKMGPRSDPSAVVDARLRVHGIRNLRVVDASIMPYLVSGHPNGPVFMIAEKAADMIKQDYNYI